MSRYLKKSQYCEVELRRNANGDFVIFHKAIDKRPGAIIPDWSKGEAFSEDTPMRDIDASIEELMKSYKG